MTKKLTEKELEERKMTRLKLKYAKFCSGCYNDSYNHKSEGDGWNAPTTGEGCFYLTNIYRNICHGRR
jgi:hypothetical protein